jgi:hypothetical protein
MTSRIGGSTVSESILIAPCGASLYVTARLQSEDEEQDMTSLVIGCDQPCGELIAAPWSARVLVEFLGKFLEDRRFTDV